jgi:hypothetical protein
MLIGGMQVLVLALAFCAPPSRPVLAEVLYDAVGDDTGYEFVEIFNPTASPVALAGLRLEAGDGSGPGRWTLRWTGQPGDTVPPGGRFVVGGDRVAPPPQAVVTLNLHNGPDAVSLVWPDGATEILGYGVHEFAEYRCNAPAPDVPAGRSLARVPDDADLGSNALDFRAAAPSPGRANCPARDVAWVAGSLALEPDQPEAGAAARLGGAVTDRGQTALAAGEVRLSARTAGAAGDRVLVETALPIALAPGDTARIAIPLDPLPEGKQSITCRLTLAGDEMPENDADSLRARVGPGPLEIAEIQFHPAHGEGEWVELRNRSGLELDPEGFTLSDRGAGLGHPQGGEAPCEPESLLVFAEDRAALLARYARLDGRRVWQVRPWAALNNTADSTGVADVVVVRDADGTPCARQAYSAAGVPAGVPLERGADGAWRPSPDPDGTPLLPPRAPVPLAGCFAVEPRRLGPGGGQVRLSWSLPWPLARAFVEVYDLAGARVARAMPEIPVTGRGERAWRATELPAGVYVVVLSARAESGGESTSAACVLRVDGVEP